MTEDNSDKRPRIYQSAKTKHGQVEMTVQGSEGETAEDICSIAKERLADLIEKQNQLEDEEYDSRETQ